MFCNNCGKPLDDNSVFCPECGTKVNNDTAFKKPAFFDEGSEKTVYVPENQNENDNNPAFFNEGSEKTVYVPENQNENDNKPAFFDEGSEKTVYVPENQNESDNVKNQYIQNASSGEIAEEEELTETPPPVENNFGDIFDDGSSNTVLLEDDNNNGSAQKNPEPISQPELIKNGDKYNTVSIPTGTSGNDQNFNQNYNQQQNNFNPNPEPVFQPAFDNGMPVQPQIPQYIPEQMPVQNVSDKVGAGRIAGASAVAFFAVVFLIILSFLLCFKFGASSGILKSRIEKLNANTLLSAEFEDDEMSDNIYKTVGFRSITHGNASEADFKEYLVKSNMLSFIGENVESYANYIFNGNGKDPSIGASEIKTDFFKANNKVADEVFGYTLNKDDLKLIEKRLEEENIDKALSIKEWNKKTGFDLKNVSYILSYITFGIFLALIIVLFIWIAIIVDKKGRHIMSFYGNILFISGIILFVSGLGVLVGSAIAYSITGNVAFYLVQNVLLMFGILAAGTGAFEIILGLIFKKIGKNKKKKEKAAAQIQQEAVPAYN